MAEKKAFPELRTYIEGGSGVSLGPVLLRHVVQHIDAQAAQIERLKAAQSMSPASAVHGEIALRWRVQEDGLYAVDMMVSNLSTEAQAHAAMAYVQSLFAGDEMAGKH